MKELELAYEALEILDSLDIPASGEQMRIIEQMEKEYLQKEVIPYITREMNPLVEALQNNFFLEISYSQDIGLNIREVERKQYREDRSSASSSKIKRQRKYIIRVVFPDNHVSCCKMVWETLMDVVRFAGADKVRKLGIFVMGDNLVSPNLNPNERYRVGQKEVEPGLYVCTFSSTETKYEQIKKINKELGLGLKIEKVML